MADAPLVWAAWRYHCPYALQAPSCGLRTKPPARAHGSTRRLSWDTLLILALGLWGFVSRQAVDGSGSFFSFAACFFISNAQKQT